MKIDNSYNASLALSTNKPANRKSENAEGGTSTSEVKLSSLAASLNSSAAEGAPVNQSRIDELKQAIASGQFKINAGAIADRLLDTAKELVQTQRRA